MCDMNKQKIIVQDYNKKWADDFLEIRDYLLSYIVDDIITIEHIGSTSVEGLAAKPIIDMNVVIKRDKLLKVINLIEQAGYKFSGDLGIADRYTFCINAEKTNSFSQHHLYLCPEDSAEHKRHILFRDYLRLNKKDRDEYSRIKKEGSKLYPHDINNYMKHKEAHILSCYKNIFKDTINPVFKYMERVDIKQLNSLRESVNWNKTSSIFEKALSNSYYYVCCYIDNQLIGFVNVISNGASDAYIQDLSVSPSYQKKGVGTMLVNICLDKLRLDGIENASVLFQEHLIEYYKKLGFKMLYAGVQ